MVERKGPWALIAEAEGKELSVIVFGVIGSILYAFGQGVNSMINTGFALFVDPVAALIDGSVGLVNEIWGGWQDIIRQGTATTVEAFMPGSMWAVGPLTQALSILSVAASLYVLARVLSSEWTSNLVPGTIIDNRFVEFLGTSPEEEGDD